MMFHEYDSLTVLSEKYQKLIFLGKDTSRLDSSGLMIIMNILIMYEDCYHILNKLHDNHIGNFYYYSCILDE